MNPSRQLHPTTSMERTGFTAHREQVTTPGITIREYFAAMAMQGLLTSSIGPDTPSTVIASLAVEQADKLIAELNKSKPS